MARFPLVITSSGTRIPTSRTESPPKSSGKGPTATLVPVDWVTRA